MDFWDGNLVPAEGFEPPTLRLQDGRSGQLSYAGILW